MRNLLHLTLAAASTVLLLGASEPERTASPPPSPRSQKPAGRVLLIEAFNDPSLDGWKADKTGVWSVSRGLLRADLPDEKQQHSILYAGSPTWTDYTVDLDVCAMRGVDKGVALRVTPGETGIAVDLRGPGYQDVLMHRRQWPMGKAAAINPNGVWHHLRVEVRGQRYRVWVNGALALEKVDTKRTRNSGGIGLAAYTGGTGQCTVYYDNVLVTAAPSMGTADAGR